MDTSLIYMKTQRSPDKMKTLYAGSTRIHHKHIASCVPYHLQYMRMSADEQVGAIPVYQLLCPDVVPAGISADMHHKHLHSFTFKETMQRMRISQIIVVTIPRDTYQRLERSEFLCQRHPSAEIPGMPYLVYRLQKVAEFRAEHPMSIRYQSYIHVKSMNLLQIYVFLSDCIEEHMELFYSHDIEGGICRLDHDESGHCIKVLRHRSGDEISVIDGEGTLYRCRITADSPKGVEAVVTDSVSGWGSHPYRLHLAVCPTKNNDRYEWFAEKACEIGFDELSPVIGDHSERRILKTARVEKILVSAAKQSLKASIPVVNEPVSVKEFIRGCTDRSLKLIAYCFEDEDIPRRSIKEVLDGFEGNDIVVMIGPEGDFSAEEARLALEAGFIPVHLGASRLRTETAAVTAAAAAYFRYME